MTVRNQKITAEFDTVLSTFILWDGQLPVRKTTDQLEIDHNVLFLILEYGDYRTGISGIDNYYVKEDSRGWIIIEWTDPDQTWADPNQVGMKRIFSKTSNEIIEERLTKVPELTGVHRGVLISDEDWASVL